MTFALAVLLLVVSLAVTAVGVFAAAVELALRNYRHSAISSLAALIAIPFVLIGLNATNLATPLVAHP